MEKRNILVVEDERPLAEAIKIKMGKSDLAVVTARTVAQALQYLKDNVKIDAIWLDHYLLGKENGLDFVVNIKATGSQWKDLPIFVVSNTASQDTMQSYLRLGAVKYFVKANYKLSEIIEEIKKFLDNENNE
jgi:DNA-binding response OmpR family regulator